MKKYLAVFSPFVYLISTKLALAQQNNGNVDNVDLGKAQGINGVNFNTPLGTVLGNAITILFTVAAILVLAMLIWGGVEWVLSGGDKEKVGNARKRIISALIGLAIIALAFLIVRVVGGIFGFNVLGNLEIPNLTKGFTPPPQ